MQFRTFPARVLSMALDAVKGICGKTSAGEGKGGKGKRWPKARGEKELGTLSLFLLLGKGIQVFPFPHFPGRRGTSTTAM